jgi:intein-encoded DNA endonuclease-like protein
MQNTKDDDLKVFKSENQPKDKIFKYKEQIIQLKKDGYSGKQISEFLKQFKGVKVSARYVNGFYKKNCEETIVETTKTVSKSNFFDSRV